MFISDYNGSCINDSKCTCIADCYGAGIIDSNDMFTGFSDTCIDNSKGTPIAVVMEFVLAVLDVSVLLVLSFRLESTCILIVKVLQSFVYLFFSSLRTLCNHAIS